MSDLPPSRINSQEQGVQFLGAVSEDLLQTLAGAQNFNNYFTYSTKSFFLNGDYSTAAPPFVNADGFQVFEFDCQIIDVWMFNLTAGSSGTTELDIKIANSSGGSFTSIFTTTPKIAFNAGNYAWVGAVNPSLIGSQYNPSPSYVAPTNTTAPVLNASITNVIPRWSGIRCDMIQSQANPAGCGLLVHFRNINTL